MGERSEVLPRVILVKREADEDCGCPEEEWDTPWGLLFMHLNAGKASDATLDNGDEGEWSTSITAPTIDAARAAIFGWAALAALTPKPEGETPDLDALASAYAAEYVMSTEGADYEPTAFERALIEDALHGFLAEMPTSKPEGETVTDDGWVSREDVARVLFDQRGTKHDFDDAEDADAESDAGTLRSICFDDADAVLRLLAASPKPTTVEASGMVERLRTFVDHIATLSDNECEFVSGVGLYEDGYALRDGARASLHASSPTSEQVERP